MKSIIKKIAGEKGVQKLRRYNRQLRYRVLRTLDRFPFLGRLAVLLFSSTYDREIRAVISGQVSHIANKQGRESVNYHLRRSIHRLEKGLSMPDRRKVFAVDIIGATVASYEQTVRFSPNHDSEELLWAHDVLQQYFESCEPHPVIDQACARFNRISHPVTAMSVGEDQARRVPYYRHTSPDLTVTYPQLLELAQRRRSVRWYEDRAVEHALIDQAIQVAAMSPSACNRQPFMFRVIDEPALLEKCRTLPMGIRGFAENIPVMIAVVGRLRAYSHPRDRHIIYVDGALAAMSFMYAAETLGLATCPINWPDIASRDKRAASILGLDDDQHIVMWISLGYPLPDGKIPYSAKTDLDAIRVFN